MSTRAVRQDEPRPRPADGASGTSALASAFANRLTVLCGPFGVGKTEIAINLAEALAGHGLCPNLVDLDVVTPYFRPRDVPERLERAGVRLVCPRGEVGQTDLPAIPPESFGLMRASLSGEGTTIVDLGGERHGAMVLAPLRHGLTAGGCCDILFVVNPYRPDSRDAAGVQRVLREIEGTIEAPMSGLVANPHLKCETTQETVDRGMVHVAEVAKALALPIRVVCCTQGFLPPLDQSVPALPLALSLAMLLPFETEPPGQAGHGR